MEIAGLIVAILGTLAAGIAAFFSATAPTKKDLAKVEANTAEATRRLTAVESHIGSVDERLGLQHGRDELVSRAQHVSIRTHGDGFASRPYTIQFTLLDPTVAMTKAELFNTDGMWFASAECIRIGVINENVFSAIFTWPDINSWYNSGRPPEPGVMIRLLKIRAHLVLDGVAVYRDFSVNLKQEWRNGPEPSSGGVAAVYLLEGNC